MYSRLRSQFGTAGLVVAIVALIAALAGGALAATGGSSGGGKATASAKGKTGPRGKTGKPGPAGPQGPPGPAGSAGPAGPAGAKGDVGASVTVTPLTSPNCEGRAGTKFNVGAQEGKACNGAQGPPGLPGPTCPGGKCLLPAGATETGAWTLGFITEGAAPGFAGPLRYAVSFSLALEAQLGEAGVHYINPAGKEVKAFATEEVTSTACTGSTANPTATPGNLCVYAAKLEGATFSSDFIKRIEEAEEAGASTAGAMFWFFNVQKEALGFGTWALTAEE